MDELQWMGRHHPHDMLAWLIDQGLADDRTLSLFTAIGCDTCQRMIGNNEWTPEQKALFVAGVACLSSEFKANLLRDLVGNPWRPFVPNAACPNCAGESLGKSLCCGVCDNSGKVGRLPHWLRWNDNTIPRMVAGIREGQNLGDIPLLGDALLDAGCDFQVLIDHCHGTVFEHKDGATHFWYTDVSGTQLTPERARQAHQHTTGCWALRLLAPDDLTPPPRFWRPS